MGIEESVNSPTINIEDKFKLRRFIAGIVSLRRQLVGVDSRALTEGIANI
jgi:hypothetical protein